MGYKHVKDPVRKFAFVGTDLVLNIKTAVAIKADIPTILSLERMKDGQVKLTYNATKIPDFSLVQSIQIVRDNVASTMREAFEAQSEYDNKFLFKRGGTIFAENIDTEDYVDSGIQGAWKLWQLAWTKAIAYNSAQIEALKEQLHFYLVENNDGE